MPNSTMLASRYPFASNADGSPATDVFYLPTTEERMSVLHARVQLNPNDATDTVDFFCGNLTNPTFSGRLTYTGNYSNGTKYPDEPGAGTNGWRDEQNLQAIRTISWVQKIAAGRPAIIAGEWHASTHYPTSVAAPSATTPWTIGDQSPEAAQRFANAFPVGHAPNWNYACTYCPSSGSSGPPNVMNSGLVQSNIHGYDINVTYITRAGFQAASVTDESMLFTNAIVQYSPGSPQFAPMSNYYGRRIRLLRPSR
jgi:hypothetical protein